MDRRDGDLKRGGAAKYESRRIFGVFFSEKMLFSEKNHPKEYRRKYFAASVPPEVFCSIPARVMYLLLTAVFKNK